MAVPALGMEYGLAALRAFVNQLRSTEDAEVMLLKDVGEVATAWAKAEGLVMGTVCFHWHLKQYNIHATARTLTTLLSAL